jgi:hypothetical protein
MPAVVLRAPCAPRVACAAPLPRRRAKRRSTPVAAASAGPGGADDGEPPRERKGLPAWPLSLWETAYLSWLGT